MLSSFFSGISGLVANSQALNIAGNNIANVNTVGYKASRATFQDVFYQSIYTSSGSAQVGRGTALSSVDTLFSQGSFESTSEPTDLAIGGDGFFIVRSPDSNELYYTRAGQFRFDRYGYLITPSGYILQGRIIDRATNTPVGVSTDIVISREPSQPRATSMIGMAVNLQSNCEWKGRLGELQGTGPITNVAPSAGKYPVVGDYTFHVTQAGNIYTLKIVVSRKGPDGQILQPPQTFEYEGQIMANTTYTNFAGSGLDITIGNLAQGSQEMTIEGFVYENMTPTKNPIATSNYSSSITVYDSLGQAHVVNVYFRKSHEVQATGNSVWEWMAVLNASDSATGKDTLVGWGELEFNSRGILVKGGDPVALEFDFSQGALPDQRIELIFGPKSGGGASTQYPIASTTNFQTQDGYPPGVLMNVTVSSEGVISGHYTNGQILDLYQITLAKFNNPQALYKEGANLYSETIDSGPAYTSSPGSGGLGRINPNSLEQSNVDLATEFVKLIVAQRGFQANARIITTTDEVLTELMNIKR
ncbi:MAG: flagellar hook protein FlgE [Desulfobacterota bacterium]|nr:flagellar hook protein FlgE [Thermodesulfobacteriota bacterium]